MQKETINCIYCGSQNTIKKGIRKNKQQTIQKYQCKVCNKFFVPIQTKYKTYPTKIILNAISYYNLGYSQIEISILINQRFKTKVPQKTISNLINEYKNICTLRKIGWFSNTVLDKILMEV